MWAAFTSRIRQQHLALVTFEELVRISKPCQFERLKGWEKGWQISKGEQRARDGKGAKVEGKCLFSLICQRSFFPSSLLVSFFHFISFFFHSIVSLTCLSALTTSSSHHMYKSQGKNRRMKSLYSCLIIFKNVTDVSLSQSFYFTFFERGETTTDSGCLDVFMWLRGYETPIVKFSHFSYP